MINLGVMTLSYRGQFIHLSPSELIRGSSHYSFALASQYERVKLDDLVQHTSTGFTLGPFGTLQNPRVTINGNTQTSYQWSVQDDLAEVELYEGQQALPSLVFTVRRPYEQLVQSSGVRLIKDDYLGELRLTLPKVELRVFKLRYQNTRTGDPWGHAQELKIQGREVSLPMSHKPNALCVVRSGKLISAYWLTNTQAIEDQEDLDQLRQRLSGELSSAQLEPPPPRVTSYLTESLKPYLDPSLHALTASTEPSDWVKLSLLYELQYLTTEAQTHGYHSLASRLQSLQSRVRMETLTQGAQELSPRSLLERLSQKLVLALELGYDDERRPQLLELSSEPWFERALPFIKGASLLEIRLCAQLFRERNHDAEQLIQTLQRSGFSIETLNELLSTEGAQALATVLLGLGDLNSSYNRTMMTCEDLREVLRELNEGDGMSLDPFSMRAQWLNTQEARRQQLKQDYESWLADIGAQLSDPPILPPRPMSSTEESFKIWAGLKLPEGYQAESTTATAEELQGRFEVLTDRSKHIQRRCDDQKISEALMNFAACSSDLESMRILAPWLEVLYPQAEVDVSLMLKLYSELKNTDLLSTVERLADQGRPIEAALTELRESLCEQKKSAIQFVTEVPASLIIPEPITMFAVQDVVQAVSCWVALIELVEGYSAFNADLQQRDQALNRKLSKAILEQRRVCQACGEAERLPRCACGWPHYLISALASPSAHQALSATYFKRLKAHKTQLWLS